MTTAKLALCSGMLLAAVPSLSSAAVVFADNFESGNLNNWTATTATPSVLVIDSTKNVIPAVGTYSAALDNTTDRMHHNLGSEVSGVSAFSYYLYDDGSTTRVFSEVRGYSGGGGVPNGGTAADGTLAQLLAIGRYNSVTLAGEVFDATKYQARLTFGSSAGWFNLNGAGTPGRSVGWHKFDIERLADGTTINFYVDSILSRTFTGADNVSWDTVVLGSALGTTPTQAWFDGVSVTTDPVPEPSVTGLGLLAGVALLRRRRAA
ncbi:MAG: hypothetical protein V4726_13445 [Verrucomicrobiota bacterium]